MTSATDRPKVQIGISIHNQNLAQIKQCIESCLGQQGVTLRIDVRTDGHDATTPESRAWLKQVSLQYPNFYLEESDQNLGTYGSYQKIFANSESEFLCQVDSDDALANGALLLTTQALQNKPELGMAYTQCVEMDEEGFPLRIGKRQETPFSMENHLVNFMTFHLRMIRRSFFNEIGGFNTRLRYAGDYDVSLKLAEISDVIFINRPLYYYRLHSGSLSQVHSDQLNQEVEFICNQALERRGLSHRYKIKVNCDGRTYLISLKDSGPSFKEEGDPSKPSGKVGVGALRRKVFYISPKEMHSNGAI